MASNTVRSVYGSSLQTTQLLGLPFSLIPNTTLNEKFNIQSGIPPINGEIPRVKYWGIGSGGHSYQVGAGGIPIVVSIPHVATDAALYNHIPFVLRPIANDLSSLEQAKYALRRVETYNAAQYVAYYLRRLDTTGVVVTINEETIVNGVTTTTAFVPDAGNLSPTPPDISGNGSNVLESTYANVSAQLAITLTAGDCSELLNAATIIYDDPAYAIISEITLCSGVDKTITLSGGASFNEAVSVQAASFISTFHPISFTPTGLTGTYDVGVLEPMLVIQ